jgi:hypothetical protein
LAVDDTELRMTLRGSRSVFAVAAVLAFAPTLVPAAPRPDRAKTAEAKALAKAEATVLDAAVAALKKEYAEHLKSPQANRLRPQCSYFLDNPVELSPDSVLDVLERPLGDDPRGVAYVKWQLLSGAPEKFDAAVLPRVLAVYQAAPLPPPRFGLSQEDRSKLDALLPKARKEDDAALSVKVEECVAEEAEANRPILAYRAALYAKLPEGFDSLVAGFRDAHERTAAAAGGGSYDEHCEKVVKDALAWAQSGSADADDCGQLAELVAKLRFVRSPAYYSRAAWRSDRLAWSTKTDAVYSAKKLSDLEKVLREVHKNGKAQQAVQHNARPNRK